MAAATEVKPMPGFVIHGLTRADDEAMPRAVESGRQHRSFKKSPP
jgi:hypothetical protein